MGVRAPQAAQPPVAEVAPATWVAPIAAWVAMGPGLAQAVPQGEAAVPTARAAMRAWVARLSVARPLAGTTARATPEATQTGVALRAAAERARAEPPWAEPPRAEPPWAEPPRAERPGAERLRVARAWAEPPRAERPGAERLQVEAPLPVALAGLRPRAEAPLRVARAGLRPRAEAPLRAVLAVLRLPAVPAVATQARVLCLATSSLAPAGRSACRGFVNVRPVAPFVAEYVWPLLICRAIQPIVGRRVAGLPVRPEQLVPRAFAAARPPGKRLVLGHASTCRPIPRTAANALPCAPAGSVRRGSVAR
jgi:hypothetical protein